MSAASPQTFISLADGTILLRQPDGTYTPVRSETDYAKLDALSESEIEQMAASDPDHPALDDAFWANAVDQRRPGDSRLIEVDEDVLSYFQQQGRGVQMRINAVLRDYVGSRQRERG